MVNKDTAIGKYNRIGDQTIIQGGVILHDNVKIGKYVTLENIIINDHSFIERGVCCTGKGTGTIIVGQHCYIGINNILDWSENITIGDFVHIAGPSTGIWTHTSVNMCINGVPLSDGDDKLRPRASVTIENNVYIGGNCTIYPGTTIGTHSIITPNSAVVSDIPPFTMVGGVPAKFIKTVQLRNE